MKRVVLPLLSLASGVALFFGDYAPAAPRSATILASLSIPPVLAPVPSRVHTDVSAGNVIGALAVAVTAPTAAPVRAFVNTLTDERAKARRKIRDAAAGTYIGEILEERDSSIARWASRKRPLTVWIQPKSRVPDFSPNYITPVRQAFEEWGALNLPIRFAFVRDSIDAEVHVKWIDKFTVPISGRTRWSRDDDWVITDADITLAMHHNQGDLLDEVSMRAMALHEIGHLLGLDHTRDTLSVMAPKVRVRELSDADRATVRLVYALPAGPLR